MKKSILVFSIIALLASSVSAQVEPKPVATEKVSWPGPDVWGMDRHVEYKDGHWLTAEKLLSSKSVYVQSALPPENAGAPEWVTQRYKVVTSPSEAELFIFVKSTSVKRSDSLSESLQMMTDTLAKKDISNRPIEMVNAYSILVTDRNGVRVMSVYKEQYVMAAWKELLRMTLYEENYQKKHAKK